MEVFHPGDHGSTYGGNPVAARWRAWRCRVLVEENLVENSRAAWRLLHRAAPRTRLAARQGDPGKGLWIGIELHPEAGGARRFSEQLQRLGLLCKETHTHTIRIAPPLTIRREEIDWALERLAQVLTADAPVPVAAG